MTWQVLQEQAKQDYRSHVEMPSQDAWSRSHLTLLMNSSSNTILTDFLKRSNSIQ